MTDDLVEGSSEGAADAVRADGTVDRDSTDDRDSTVHRDSTVDSNSTVDRDRVEALANVAARAVEAGGSVLRDRFRDGGLDADYTTTDVKTAADRAAEERVLSVVRDAYPDHRITAEESGDHPGDGDYRWVVDALDGTNNFAIGVPTFGVAATACDDDTGTGTLDDPVATAVGVPLLDDVYVATRGGGVRYDGTPVTVDDGDTISPGKCTVGMIIGPKVVSGGQPREEWDAITAAVESVTKRAIQTWAPVVYWGLFARGKLDGFVCYYPAEREQVAGELLAREAGAVGRSEGPLTVFADDEETLDELWNAASGAI